MTYTYRHIVYMPGTCTKLMHFEVTQPMSAEALTRCPDCGASVERVMLASQLITRFTPKHH